MDVRSDYNLLPWEPVIRGTFGIISAHIAEAGDECEVCGTPFRCGDLVYSAWMKPCFCSYDCAIKHPFNTIIDKGAF